MGLGLNGTIDTNILLRFLLADDAVQYQAAKKLIERPTLLWVSVLSIAELVFVLEGKGFSRLEIRENIMVLSSYKNLYLTRNIILPAIDLYVNHPALSFVDTCLAYESKEEYAEPLYTFDKKLAKQTPHTKLVA
jgi:predicted nucleic-acid-binding protein